MQIQNLQIFDFATAVATNGPWIDISNLVSLSVQINNYGSAGIEVSNDPNVMIDGPVIGPPSVGPVLSQFASTPGSSALTGQGPYPSKPDASMLPAQTFYVVTTFVTKWGETTASGNNSLAVTAGNYLFVAAPVPSAAQAPAVIGWNVYVSLTGGAGTYVLQGAPGFDPQRLVDGIGSVGGTVDPLGPSSSTHFAISNALPLQQNFAMVNGFQNTGYVPPASDQSGGTNSGVNVGTFAASPDSAVATFISGGNVMWSPSSMTWKFLRVIGGGATTVAWINGQRG
jgi:hypothetical protein